MTTYFYHIHLTDIMNIDVLEIRDHRIETTVVRLKEQPQGDDSDSDKD